MKVRQTLWSVQKLVDRKADINLNPAWQRGPAWTLPRKVLLIDSILRQMDVPKIYLHCLPKGGIHTWEAVDGQQRLRTIWDFVSPAANRADGPGFALKTKDSLPAIDGEEIAGKAFGQLSKRLRDRLLAFELGVGEIAYSTNDEITVLFARLQMGMPLNPAELRNADLGRMRNMIQLVTTSHPFFANAAIPNLRNKHFDFASYAFAIAESDGSKDLKAPDLRELQREYNGRPAQDTLALSSKVGDALNVLAEVDLLTRFRVNRKWIFVDLLKFIMDRQEAGIAIDPARLTRAYDKFEERRRKYTSHPDVLLKAGRSDAERLDQTLYEYMYAFRADGAKAQNIKVRARAIALFLKNIEVR